MGNKAGCCHKLGCKEKCCDYKTNEGIIKISRYCCYHKCFTNDCDHYGNYTNGHGPQCIHCYGVERDAFDKMTHQKSNEWYTDPSNPYGIHYEP